MILRRSAATNMQDFGVRGDIVSAILNQRLHGVGGVYLRSELETQKREALRSGRRRLAASSSRRWWWHDRRQEGWQEKPARRNNRRQERPPSRIASSAFRSGVRRKCVADFLRAYGAVRRCASDLRDHTARTEWSGCSKRATSGCRCGFSIGRSAILEQIPRRSLRKRRKAKTGRRAKRRDWALVMPIAEAARLVATIGGEAKCSQGTARPMRKCRSDADLAIEERAAIGAPGFPRPQNR